MYVDMISADIIRPFNAVFIDLKTYIEANSKSRVTCYKNFGL